MRLKHWIPVAALGLLVPIAGHAATEANFGARTTGDLVALCSATPDNGLGTAALNFCEGYLEGAVSVEILNQSTFRGPRLFCLPNPPPTRLETMGEFVSWARASPDRTAQVPTDGLFRFLSERYQCSSSH